MVTESNFTYIRFAINRDKAFVILNKSLDKTILFEHLNNTIYFDSIAWWPIKELPNANNRTNRLQIAFREQHNNS